MGKTCSGGVDGRLGKCWNPGGAEDDESTQRMGPSREHAVKG